VHPLRESGFRFVERLGAADGLAACFSRIPCRRTTFPAQLQFKLGKACEHTGHHAACRVARVDPLA